MSKPTEHKTVQARILAYAQEIGWSLVTRDEAELRRGKTKGGQECPPSLFFEDLLHAQVLKFNPLYAEAEGSFTNYCISLCRTMESCGRASCERIWGTTRRWRRS